MTIKPPFPIGVEFAPGANLAGDPGDYPYVDISGRRRQSAPVELTYGRDDEGSDVDFGAGVTTFDDRDGDLSPWNPVGQWYGLLAENVPVRFRIDESGDTFDRAAVSPGWGTSTSGHTWSNTNGVYSTDGSVARVDFGGDGQSSFQVLQGAGAPDLDVTFSMEINAYTAGDTYIVAPMVRVVDTDNHMPCYLEFRPDGTISIKPIYAIGGSYTSFSELFGALTYTPDSKVWCRYQCEGADFRIRIWNDGDPEPDQWAVTWSDYQVLGTGVGMLFWRRSGETANCRMTIDDLQVAALLFSGYAADLPPRWDFSGNDATTPFEISGIMRRLGQQSGIRSPLYRQLVRYDPAGYWPLEDGSDASYAASAVPGGAPATIYDVSFGGDSVAGGDSSAEYAGDLGRIYGVAPTTTPAEFAVMFLMKMENNVTADTLLAEFGCPSGTARKWQIWASATSFKVVAVSSSGSTVSDSGYVLHLIDTTAWFAIQLETTQSGGTVSYTLLWYQVIPESGVFWALGDSFSGSLGGVRDFLMRTTAELQGTQFAHVWLGAETLPFVDSTFVAVVSGYPGETASDRITRLCAEEGIPVAVAPGDSAQLGAQRSGEFLDLLRAAAKADFGVLYERAAGLGFTPHGARYETPVTLILDWGGGELAEAPEPARGDQQYVSQYTAKRLAGSEVTAEADAVIVQRRGVKKGGEEFTLYADDQLEDQAAWGLHIGTWGELRWPRIKFSLLQHRHLIDDWVKCGIGSRVRIVNPKTQVAGIYIDLIIEGVQQEIGRYQWDVTLSCSPAGIYAVGIYDDGVSRYDSSSTFLHADVSASATSLVFETFDDGDVWSMTETGYIVSLGGEDVRIDAMGAVSGSGPYLQTATVTRSMNGVVKAQPGATMIHVRNPGRYAR
ncbi:hypothetical protein [Mangrovihabitans endophyticus]|uniref:Uncharacterized protein n=1 Tax=Mangrovihabitans endophyticus TaxID=1751298 RepID=A0A8J3FP24_9ACTN|nr:hypothetical protein [Mangrovihabitans endophyticus]GGK89106.1 hypothetical protein GCM10012284_23930 [Mangrovihabitans endophyticus]